MSFAKLVTLSMLTAFSAGAGYSYIAERHGLPMPGVVMSREIASTTKIETVSRSVQLIKTSPTTSKVKAEAFKQYTMCSGAKRYHCVVDGDTIWHQGKKIRIADIDTPEVGQPKCSSEAALGAKATKRLLQLVNAGPFAIESIDRDEDKYGRKLRLLVRDGRSLGDILVSEGLARTWSGRREPWC